MNQWSWSWSPLGLALNPTALSGPRRKPPWIASFAKNSWEQGSAAQGCRGPEKADPSAMATATYGT